MITELTAEQEKMIPIYEKKWLDIGRSTERLDRDQVNKSIKWAYEFINKKPPKIIYCESPFQAQKLVYLLKEEKRSLKQMTPILDDKDKLKEYTDKSGPQKFHPFFSPSLLSYWVGFYDYILNELLPQKKEEFKEFLNECRHFYTHNFYMIPYEYVCIVSERPLHVHIDEDYRLHCGNGSAMGFSDGWDINALKGIFLEKEMMSYSPSEIMGVENVEQRLVLMENCGIENMLKELRSEIMDSYLEYKLHKVWIEGSENRLLQMDNPSEPKTHYEFVSPHINTCKQAMAERLGIDIYKDPIMKA